MILRRNIGESEEIGLSHPQSCSDWSGWDALTPSLRYANFYDAQPGGGFGPRYIPDFQLLIVQDGSGEALLGDAPVALARHDLLFYGPNVRHSVTSSIHAPLRLIGLHFLFYQEDASLVPAIWPQAQRVPFAFMGTAPRCLLDPPPLGKTAGGATNKLNRLSESLVLSYIANPHGENLAKRALLLFFFAAWHEAQQQAAMIPALPPHVRAMIDHTQEYLLARLTNPPTTAELAARVGVSAGAFSRLFKSGTGMTIHAYLLQQQVAAAKRLLVEGRLPIQEIAQAVGFVDPFYFSRIFHRIVGFAPSAFRKQHAMVEAEISFQESTKTSIPFTAM